MVYNKVIKKIMSKDPNPISGMVNFNQIKYILFNLSKCVELEGDVVELGCNVGTTTLYLRRFLEEINSKKEIHVFDSFEGLPEKSIDDMDTTYSKGSCKIPKDHFEYYFNLNKLKLPIINVGWFAEIPDDKYPEKICFAFFDGDFYSSIIDSFNKVYSKMVPGGIVLIHDYEYSPLPGVKKACEDFLADKPEDIIYEGNCVAKLIKQ